MALGHLLLAVLFTPRNRTNKGNQLHAFSGLINVGAWSPLARGASPDDDRPTRHTTNPPTPTPTTRHRPLSNPLALFLPLEFQEGPVLTPFFLQHSPSASPAQHRLLSELCPTLPIVPRSERAASMAAAFLAASAEGTWFGIPASPGRKKRLPLSPRACSGR